MDTLGDFAADRVRIAEGLSLSRLVYGMWRLGDDADISAGHVRAKIDAALDRGITTLDQADIYGDYTAEAILGQAFRADPGLRNRVELVTKCGIVAPCGRYADAACKHYDTSAAHITASVEKSLRDLGADHIDLLLIHRPDPLMDPHETGAALDGLIRSGKIRAAGVSNFRPWDVELLQAAMRNTLVTNQIELSLARPQPFADGDLAFHQRRGDPVMAWSPLGGGSVFEDVLGTALSRLADQLNSTTAGLALAWLRRLPGQPIPVIGTLNERRIDNLLLSSNLELDRPTWFALLEEARRRAS